MDKIFMFCWGTAEIFTAALLLKGLDAEGRIAGFLTFHCLTVLFTYMVFYGFFRSDDPSYGPVKTRGFLIFLGTPCLIPVIGPAISVFIMIYFKYFMVIPLRTESFKRISQDVLIDLQKQIEGRTIPITEALLIRQLSKDNALKMLGVIDEMDWTAVKSSILKYIIRLSPHQNIVLMAIDLLKKRTDAILSEIGTVESATDLDHDSLRRLAYLYHEICYLDLCEPIMKQVYLEKACDYAFRAFKAGRSDKDDALLIVRYMLEAGRVDEAHSIYIRIRETGDYQIPKWASYEFELSVRRLDMELFNHLYPLIVSAGGVHFPEKVKRAAKAWKRVLTSAWL